METSSVGLANGSGASGGGSAIPPPSGGDGNADGAGQPGGGINGRAGGSEPRPGQGGKRSRPRSMGFGGSEGGASSLGSETFAVEG